jgi:hypothetical protein
MAIMLESGDVQWRPKANADVSDTGPDDRKLIIEFEGDLENMAWISNLSCESAKVDLNMLVATVPELFDKAWLRHQGLQEADIAIMGDHNIIEITVKK